MLTLNLKKKLKKIPGILRNEGLYGIYWRIMVRIAGDPYHKDYQKSYLKWYEKNGIHTIDIEKQIDEVKKFASKPLISLITPTYNTNPNYLKECIKSVTSQTYTNWELILIDDNSPNQEVRNIIENYSKKDSRIKFVFRKYNGHISIASNDGLNNSKGEWIGLLDHDDILWPNALFEVVKRINEKPKAQFIYSDEDKIAEDGKTHCDPFFKPDWSPHFLWSCNYITHFAVINKNLIEKVDGFRKETDGAQDWDLFLRVVDAIDGFSDHPWSPDCKIQHIDTILYSWRKSETSTASEKHSLSAKSYAYTAQEIGLKNYFETKNGAEIRPTKYLGIYDIEPKSINKPLISIIIPSHNQTTLVEKLINSILKKSIYPDYEIIIVSNNSTKESVDFYKKLILNMGKVIEINEVFNFSKLCNAGAKISKAEVLVFLNNDTEIITHDWLEKMLSLASQPEVGAVGPRLIYSNDRIQNNGLVFTKQIHHEKINIGEFVAPYFRNSHKNQNFGVGTVLLSSIRDYSSITGAAIMIERKKFDIIKGWNEDLTVAFNDIDFCLKLNEKNLFTLINPNVEMIHNESETIGLPNENRIKQLEKEEKILINRWHEKIKKDAFFSEKNLLHKGKIFIKTSI